MEHHTDTFVDEKNGVQAFCMTCKGPLGTMHGRPDGMSNLEALSKCQTERWEHQNGVREVVR